MKFNLKNPYNWVLISIVLTLILALVTRFTGSNVFYTATLISIVPWCLFIIIGILFTWIINPLRALIYWIKKKVSEK